MVYSTYVWSDFVVPGIQKDKALHLSFYNESTGNIQQVVHRP